MKNNGKAVFIGNGINRLENYNTLSWDDLLNSLALSETLLRIFPKLNTIDFKNPLKPFPFIFEELLQSENTKEIEFNERVKIFKEEIRKLLENQVKNKIEYNKFHKSIMNSQASDVITSNYDYGFELAGNKDFFSQKEDLAGFKKELTANIKRSYWCNNKRIWHMHGELYDCRKHSKIVVKDYPEQSILLGYSHYLKNISDIEKYVKGEKENTPRVIRRLTNNEDMNISWIDKFFTHDIDIFGISLGFEEQDIWWLLNYRAEIINRKTKLKKVLINNTINFYIPEFEENDYGKKSFEAEVSYKKNLAVIDVLKLHHVNVIKYRAKNWEDFYEKIIQKI